MSENRDPEAEQTPEEERLAKLLVSFEEMREKDASVKIGILEEQAGDLFPELTEVADCLGLLRDCLEEEKETPSRIGRYEIEGLIGAGGCGIVYRARDPSSGEIVAVKIMRDALSLGGKAAERFEREIKAVRRLDHPHVVQILDSGEADGRPFMVMRLVEGQSLAQVLRGIGGPGLERPGENWGRILDQWGVPDLPGECAGPEESYARRTAALFSPLAGALAAASEAGLVHRDLKPGNLILDRDGRLQITDFGLAKLLDEEITSTVAVLGTPAYMSPEQASGRSREVDLTSDIYGLGASLYAALSGHPPVQAESFSEILGAIRTIRPDPLHRFCAAYPRGLSRIVARCLEKNPEDRYADARLLEEDLTRVSEGNRPRHASLPFRRRIRKFAGRHRMVIAAGILLVAVVTGAFFWFTRTANLAVIASPEGTVTVDGEILGVTPYQGEIARGVHEVVVAREHFQSFRERLDLGAGETGRLVVQLWPKNLQALRCIAEARDTGLRLPTGAPARIRALPPDPSDPWLKKITLAGPRGKISREGLGVVLHKTEQVTDLRMELVEPGTGQVLYHAPLASQPGWAAAPLPAEIVARLGIGSSYDLRIRRTGDEGDVSSTFILSTEAHAEEPLEDPESIHTPFLVVARLLDTGYSAEALLRAAQLAGEHPDLPLPWRLGLEALVHLRLQESPLYAEFMLKYQEARDLDR